MVALQMLSRMSNGQQAQIGVQAIVERLTRPIAETSPSPKLAVAGYNRPSTIRNDEMHLHSVRARERRGERM